MSDCRALKSERKTLDKEFDGTIKPLILFWPRATVNGGNCEFAATNPISRWLERHYSERKVMPRHSKARANVMIGPLVTSGTDHSLGYLSGVYPMFRKFPTQPRKRTRGQ